MSSQFINFPYSIVKHLLPIHCTVKYSYYSVAQNVGNYLTCRMVTKIFSNICSRPFLHCGVVTLKSSKLYLVSLPLSEFATLKCSRKYLTKY